MCHWSKGIQIRYNISHLEQWLRDQNIPGQETMSANIVDTLQPIIQAANLLQARKSDADVINICTFNLVHRESRSRYKLVLLKFSC